MRPVSRVRNGVAPNCGSSATSSLWSSTAGRGNSLMDSDSNFTGRPIACVALPAIIAWTRGVSMSLGSAIAATISSTTTTAPIPMSHFMARLNAPPPERLCGLDRRKPPGLRADRPREGPVFLDVDRRGRSLDHGTGRVVHRVVDERNGEVDRGPVLAALLPGFAHLGPPDSNPLDAVCATRAAELITLRLQPRVLLRREAILHGGQVPPGDPFLDIDESRLGELDEAVGIEARVHAANVLDPPIEVRHARRDLHRGGAASGRPALPGRARGAPAVDAGVRGLRLAAAAEHAEEEEHRAADQQELEEPEAAAEATAHAAEQHRAEQPAEGEAGDAAHEAAEHAGALRLSHRRWVRGRR